MNRLNQIKALHLKGTAIDANLTPLTAVVGPNAAGKSAVAAAVTIALLGHVPALGKQGNRTVQLMTPGAPMLDVLAVLESGERINRRFDVNKAGAVKTTFTGPDFSDTLNPCQLDFDQFRLAKPTERQRVLESLMAAVTDADVVEDARTRIAKAGLDITITTAGGWLQKLEEDAKNVGKLTKQDSDTAAKTILQLQGEEQPEAIDVEALERATANLAAAREKLGQTRETFDNLAAAQQDAPDQPDGEEVTEAAINAQAADVERIEKEVARIREGLREFKAAEERRDEILRPHAGIEPVEAAAEPMTGEELVKTQRKIADQKTELRVEMGKVEANLKNAEKDLQDVKAKREKLMDTDCCPTCGTKGREFHQAVSDLFDSDVQAKEDRVLALKNDFATLERGVDAFVEVEAAHLAKVKEREQHAAFLAHVRAGDVMKNVTKPGDDLAAYESALTIARAKLSRLRSDARQWVEWRAAKVPTQAAVEAAEKAWRDASAEITRLEGIEAGLKTREAAIQAWRGNQARIAEMERENVKRASEIEAARELAAWAKTKSRELTAAAMRPLLDVCNRVLEGLVDGTIAIDGTVVGVLRADHLIPLEVLSGSEAAALSSAIQIAIASKSPFRIVLIDELSRFAVERKKRFVENLHAAIADGLVDQVLVFDHDPATGAIVEAFDTGSQLAIAGE